MHDALIIDICLDEKVLDHSFFKILPELPKSAQQWELFFDKNKFLQIMVSKPSPLIK